MKLIPMTEYIDVAYEKWVSEKCSGKNASANYLTSTLNYSRFLKQPLALWMFVPCDEKGNALREPKVPHTFASENSDVYISQWRIEKDNYEAAKQRCLFEGFKLIGSKHVETLIANYPIVVGVGFKNGTHQTIENLVNQGIPLTKTALKTL